MVFDDNGAALDTEALVARPNDTDLPQQHRGKPATQHHLI